MEGNCEISMLRGREAGERGEGGEEAGVRDRSETYQYHEVSNEELPPRGIGPTVFVPYSINSRIDNITI